MSGAGHLYWTVCKCYGNEGHLACIKGIQETDVVPTGSRSDFKGNSSRGAWSYLLRQNTFGGLFTVSKTNLLPNAVVEVKIVGDAIEYG